MSTQIAVRVSEDLVQFVDEIVESGTERSRAAVVSRALETIMIESGSSWRELEVVAQG
jgi:Arc/MetJ-type ribon-helix-helix transcriptional regulator